MKETFTFEDVLFLTQAAILVTNTWVEEQKHPLTPQQMKMVHMFILDKHETVIDITRKAAKHD